MKVYLVQPESGVAQSGGFAYNRAVARALAALGQGGLRETTRAALPHQPSQAGEHRLIDSLFLDEPLKAAERKALSAQGGAYHLLLHLLPFDDPTASVAQKDRWRTAIESWLPLVGGVFVTGQNAAQEWTRHFPNGPAPHVASPAIPIARRKVPAAGNTLRLVTIGGLCRRKNQRFILDELRRHRDTDFVWNVIGSLTDDLAYTAAFRREAASLGGRVKLHGSVPPEDCDAILDQADLYVSASVFESFGIANATALARGVPTLAFQVGDLAHWTEPGPGCWLHHVPATAAFARDLASLLRQAPPYPVPPRPRLTPTTWTGTAERILAAL